MSAVSGNSSSVHNSSSRFKAIYQPFFMRHTIYFTPVLDSVYQVRLKRYLQWQQPSPGGPWSPCPRTLYLCTPRIISHLSPSIHICNSPETLWHECGQTGNYCATVRFYAWSDFYRDIYFCTKLVKQIHSPLLKRLMVSKKLTIICCTYIVFVGFSRSAHTMSVKVM